MVKYEITKGAAYGLLVLFVTVVGMFIISIVFAGKAAESAREDADRAIRESEKTHCIVYDFVHEGQIAAPPATPQGQKFAEAVNKIRTALRCDEEK